MTTQILGVDNFTHPRSGHTRSAIFQTYPIPMQKPLNLESHNLMFLLIRARASICIVHPTPTPMGWCPKAQKI